MKTLLFLFLSVFNLSILFSQSTPQPTPPIGGTNSVGYSKSSNSYLFNYSGPDGSVTYTYDLDNGGSFEGLTANLNNNFSYWPCSWGGLVLNVSGIRFYPWDLTYILLNSELVNNRLIVTWKALAQTPFWVVEYTYSYSFYIEGRTLIMEVNQISNENIAEMFYLHTSESDPNFYPDVKHYSIDIPYLKLFNILYTGSYSNEDNVGAFTSLFFDWTVTNASELNVLNGNINDHQIKYSQQAVYKEKTDLNRNHLSERLFLTVSPKLEEVFPNIPNPVSNFRNESINRVIFDYWQSFPNIWNTTTPWELRQLGAFGTNNGWFILHNWQNGGYDCGYPSNIMPSNPNWGGDEALINVRNIAVNELGYRFSLHEDYWFIEEGVPGYNQSVLSLPITSWNWCSSDNIKEHPIKPTLYSYFYNWISPQIDTVYGTNSAYDDAYTNAPPDFYVDYDYTVEGAGKFLFTYQKLRQAATDLQTIHEGPVSAEGGSHMLYVGYYDDFEAEIFTGKHYTTNYRLGGYYRPLLVDFDILKMREKSFVHGMGYYDRFFCDGFDYNNCQYHGPIGNKEVLEYTATELAYAHGGFFEAKYDNNNLMYQANAQFNHVYPMQSLYANSNVSSILYNDNGSFLTVSEYIMKYPDTYNCFINSENCYNDNFMGQVKITYVNGVVVYVNRHPWKTWDNIPISGSWYNCHASINGGFAIVLETGTINGQNSFSLPPENGWVCFSPIIPQTSGSSNKNTDFISPFKFNLSQNYPNPFNPSTEIGFEIAKEVSVSIKIYNILGQLVTTLINEVKKPGIYKTSFDGRNFASGVYFYKIEAGDFIDRKKMVLIK